MNSRPLRSLSILSVFLIGLCSPADAELVVTSTNSASGSFPGYSIGFTGSNAVTAEAGDYLVVAHTNDFPFDSFSVSDSITISNFGTDVFSALSSGDPSEDTSAWMFYTPVSADGTFDLTFTGPSSGLPASLEATYWVVRPDAGEVITVADTATIFGSDPTTSLDLEFDFSAGITNGLGFAAAASDGSPITPSSEWDAETLTGTYFAGDVDGTEFNSTFTNLAREFSLAGIVLTTAVPEPSSCLMFTMACSILARRRRTQ